MSIPPTNPTLPVFDAIAAAMPTRNEPSCSLKTIDRTLGRSTTASTIANLRFGNSRATFSIPLAWEKPIPTTIAEPRRAMLRSACSRWASAVTSNSRYAIPVSFLKRSAPAYAASLNDLSNFPPMSNTTAGTNSCAVAGLGYEVLDPWALADQAKIDAVQRLPYGPEKREAWRKLNREIGATNQAAIDRADGVVAVLDGTDVDSGTAAEIGYAFARGKLIVGYRGDFRLSADNEGSTVNLQVEFFIRESGGTIVSRYEDLGPSLRGPRAAAPCEGGRTCSLRSVIA